MPIKVKAAKSYLRGLSIDLRPLSLSTPLVRLTRFPSHLREPESCISSHERRSQSRCIETRPYSPCVYALVVQFTSTSFTKYTRIAFLFLLLRLRAPTLLHRFAFHLALISVTCDDESDDQLTYAGSASSLENERESARALRGYIYALARHSPLS